MKIILTNWNLQETERILVEDALRTAGTIHEAAKLLGTTREGVKRRILKHKIPWPRLTPPTPA